MSGPRLRLVPGSGAQAAGGGGSEPLSPARMRELVFPMQVLLSRYTPPAQLRATIRALDQVIELWALYLVALDEPVPVRVRDAVGAARDGVAHWIRRASSPRERRAVFAAVKEARVFVAGRKDREAEAARRVCTAALALVAVAIEDSSPEPTDVERRLANIVFVCGLIHNEAFPDRRNFVDVWLESLEDIESGSSIQ